MTRSEKHLVDAFVERTAMPESELMAGAGVATGANLLRGAYWSLQAKGVLALDSLGIVTLDRKQAAKVAAEAQLYEPLDGE